MDAKGIALASILRADAYIAHYPFLNKLVLPAGVSDLLNNRPPIDTVMLAPKASLAVRADLHPAIQHLLLTAAPDLFAARNFPEGRTISSSRIDRYSAQRRSAAFLQIGTTIPSKSSSVLDRDPGRTNACRVPAFGSRAVSDVQVPAANLRLGHAVQNKASVR